MSDPCSGGERVYFNQSDVKEIHYYTLHQGAVMVNASIEGYPDYSWYCVSTLQHRAQREARQKQITMKEVIAEWNNHLDKHQVDWIYRIDAVFVMSTASTSINTVSVISQTGTTGYKLYASTASTY